MKYACQANQVPKKGLDGISGVEISIIKKLIFIHYYQEKEPTSLYSEHKFFVFIQMSVQASLSNKEKSSPTHGC